MSLQSFMSDFIIAMIQDVESHEAKIHCKFMKNIEVSNKHKMKMVSSWLFYPFGNLSARDSQMKYRQKQS